MSRYFDVKISTGISKGPYSIYYDRLVNSVVETSLAVLTSGGLAENLSFTVVTTGVNVTVSDDAYLIRISNADCTSITTYDITRYVTSTTTTTSTPTLFTVNISAYCQNIPPSYAQIKYSINNDYEILLAMINNTSCSYITSISVPSGSTLYLGCQNNGVNINYNADTESSTSICPSLGTTYCGTRQNLGTSFSVVVTSNLNIGIAIPVSTDYTFCGNPATTTTTTTLPITTTTTTISPLITTTTTTATPVCLGLLYNWYAASSNIIAPSGWRVPTYSDYQYLSNFVGTSSSVNLLLNTNGLNGYNWAGYCGNLTNVTYNTSDLTAPNGTNTATKIVRDSSTSCGAGGAWGLYWNDTSTVNVGTTYTATIYVKSVVGGESVQFGITDGKWAAYTLTTSWQRITYTTTATSVNRGLEIAAIVSQNFTYYVWGAQLESGSVASAYSNSVGISGGALKATGTTYWNSPNTLATNSVYFNGRGNGYRSNIDGSFNGLKNVGTFHISGGPSSSISHVMLELNYNNQLMNITSPNDKIGAGIRLIKNDSVDPTTVMDYDGNLYLTSVIGSQVWMAENFKCTHYTDGTIIPEVTDNTTWSQLTSGARASYNNTSSYSCSILSSLTTTTTTAPIIFIATSTTTTTIVLVGTTTTTTSPITTTTTTVPITTTTTTTQNCSNTQAYITSISFITTTTTTYIGTTTTTTGPITSTTTTTAPITTTTTTLPITSTTTTTAPVTTTTTTTGPITTTTTTTYVGTTTTTTAPITTTTTTLPITTTTTTLPITTTTTTRPITTTTTTRPITTTTTTTVSIPTVTTTAASSITNTTASSGGNVTATGGATVTARGVCWNTVTNPTTGNTHTTDGSGTGVFTSLISGLTANTTYYYRAYATNSVGTAYGTVLSFTTLNNTTTTTTQAITTTTTTLVLTTTTTTSQITTTTTTRVLTTTTTTPPPSITTTTTTTFSIVNFNISMSCG